MWWLFQFENIFSSKLEWANCLNKKNRKKLNFKTKSVCGLPIIPSLHSALKLCKKSAVAKEWFHSILLRFFSYFPYPSPNFKENVCAFFEIFCFLYKHFLKWSFLSSKLKYTRIILNAKLPHSSEKSVQRIAEICKLMRITPVGISLHFK